LLCSRQQHCMHSACALEPGVPVLHLAVPLAYASSCTGFLATCTERGWVVRSQVLPWRQRALAPQWRWQQQRRSAGGAQRPAGSPALVAAALAGSPTASGSARERACLQERPSRSREEQPEGGHAHMVCTSGTNCEQLHAHTVCDGKEGRESGGAPHRVGPMQRL